MSRSKEVILHIHVHYFCYVSRIYLRLIYVLYTCLGIFLQAFQVRTTRKFYFGYIGPLSSKI